MSMIDVNSVPTTWQAGLDPHWAWRVPGSILQRREPLRPYRSDAAEAPPEAIFILKSLKAAWRSPAFPTCPPESSAR